MKIDSCRLCKNWEDFIESSQLKPATIYAENYKDLAAFCEKTGWEYVLKPLENILLFFNLSIFTLMHKHLIDFHSIHIQRYRKK